MKKSIFLLLLLITFTSCTPTTTKTSLPPQKTVYLTFDDGPSPVTLQILETLNEYKIKATFFVVGSFVKQYPEILLQIYDDGHSIGIHSDTHQYKEIYFDGTSLKKDVENCKNEICKIIPTFNTKLYRFPGGSFNLRQEFKTLIKDMGYNYYDWNASVCDAEKIKYSPQQLCQNALDTSTGKEKVILLCHDTNTKQNTAQALPYIIQEFTLLNFCFKAL